MIKLIVSDIDGTLVRDGSGTMNPEFYDVILKLREKGIQFAAASGRQWASIEHIFYPIRKKIFYISGNGGYLGCHGRSLYITPIERCLVLDIIDEVRRNPQLELLMAGPDVDYMESDNDELADWVVNSYKFRLERVRDLTQVEDQCIKLSIYKQSGVEAATRELRSSYEGRLKMALAGDMWMDLMAPSVSKGEAVRILQESLEIKPEETMAFGDQLNDIEMLERAYYSFAVANAREEVRRAARFQADSNVNYGVLKVLRELL